MIISTVETLAQEARAEKEISAGRIVAMWAGIAAGKAAPDPVCPFRPDEVELAEGFRRGVAIANGRRSHPSRATWRPTRGSSYAAHSAPKDEGEEHGAL